MVFASPPSSEEKIEHNLTIFVDGRPVIAHAIVWHRPARPVALGIVVGDVNHADPPLVRIQSKCTYGEVFRSFDCDCRDQLDAALSRIAMAKRGIVLYLDQEGRGAGLVEKARAYRLRDTASLDSVDAYRHLGLPDDTRDYGDAVTALKSLRVSTLQLLTNNPRKVGALQSAGFRVERVPLEIPPNEFNRGYLDSKRTKLGHLLSHSD